MRCDKTAREGEIVRYVEGHLDYGSSLPLAKTIRVQKPVAQHPPTPRNGFSYEREK